MPPDGELGAGLGGPDTAVVELGLQGAKNDSAIVLSQQIPVNPIDLVMPFSAAEVVICADAWSASRTLLGLDTNLSRQATDTDPHHDSLEPVLALSELAVRLWVSVQTLYDLRSQGRGPHGFRVGRHLRFRASEIDAWLARLEKADSERHPVGSHWDGPPDPRRRSVPTDRPTCATGAGEWWPRPVSATRTAG